MKFDEYTIKARVIPSAFVLAPIALALAAWIPFDLTNWKTFLPLGIYLGLLLILGEIGRDQGKQKEPDLFTSWGGKPSTQWLHHRSGLLDATTRSRYHSYLGELIGKSFPTAAREAKDPGAADAIYDSGIKALIEKCRDTKKFGLLFKENISYGFRRNLWGMKPGGIALAGICLAFSLVPILQASLREEAAPERAILCSILIICFLGFWAVRVNRHWVRIPADAYAQRLLASCENLGAQVDQNK